MAISNRHEEAIEWFDKVVDEDATEKLWNALDCKGVSLNKMGRHKDAIESFDAAILNAPSQEHTSILNHKGIAVAAIGMHKNAIELYDSAIESSFDKKYPPASYNKGHSLVAMGKLSEAIDSYHKAITDSVEKFPQAWYYKSKTLLTLSRKQEARHAAYRSLIEDNCQSATISYIYNYFQEDKAYSQRIAFLNTKYFIENSKLIYQLNDTNSLLTNYRYSNNSEFYCELLLNKKDVLSTGRNFYERLRLAYLIYASSNAYSKVYYIIQYLLNDGHYKLDSLDYFFYITSASEIGASKNELDIIVKNSGLKGVVFKQIDEYLFRLERPLISGNILAYNNNEDEKNIIENNFIPGSQYIPQFSRNELLLLCLAENFPTDSISPLINEPTDPILLNLIDSLKKEDIIEDQAAKNIDEFIDGSSRNNLAIVLFLLCQRESNNTDIFSLSDNTLIFLKAFSILKYELRKGYLSEREISSVNFLLKGLISTILGGVGDGITSISFLVSLGFTYSVDFCLDQFEGNRKINPDFSWQEFIDSINNKTP